MARANNQTAMFFNLFLLLSFLFIATIAESKSIAVGLIGEAKPQCASAYGVIAGDTCSDVTQKFKLDNDFFESINPNLNCTAIFVGQWVCVNGSVN